MGKSFLLVESLKMGGTALVLYLVLQLIHETKASVGNCIPRKTVKYQSK